MNDISARAIKATLGGGLAYCKFLSANDAGSTGAHQAGILVSIKAKAILFDEEFTSSIVKRTACISWNDELDTNSTFTYYESKKELRITSFGRGFPYLHPEQTGSLFVLVRYDRDTYKAYFLDTEEEIEAYLSAFSISPTETNCIIDKEKPEAREQAAIDEFIAGLQGDFPASSIMSSAAQRIQGQLYNHSEYIRSNPDKKLIDWTDMEYKLFRAIEVSQYGKKIATGFSSVEEFIELANQVLNRRKSRAGKSLEHHLSALFDGNGLEYAAQARTEGNKRPDFLFPSQLAYHTASYPADRLVSLGAKTTCKDRWRQVINEADRLRGRPKYLATLQQGISLAQLEEMEAEQVVLVVPKPYIITYPAAARDKIWTIKKFIEYVREIEGA